MELALQAYNAVGGGTAGEVGEAATSATTGLGSLWRCFVGEKRRYRY